MKTIRIDENAHEILVKAKKFLKETGVERPTLSDAIRGVYSEPFLAALHRSEREKATNEHGRSASTVFGSAHARCARQRRRKRRRGRNNENTRNQEGRKT